MLHFINTQFQIYLVALIVTDRTECFKMFDVYLQKVPTKELKLTKIKRDKCLPAFLLYFKLKFLNMAS